MGEPSGKRSLHLRLEARLHDELQQLAGEAGRGIADLVRDLLERALRDRTHLDILNYAKATARKLDQLAQIINESTAINDVTIHGYTDQIGTAS